LIVHDRTTGDRVSKSPLRAWLKRLLHRSRAISADCCIAISNFVRQRLQRVSGVPPARLELVYNGIEISLFTGQQDGRLHALLGLASDTRIVFCSGRAQEYKGIHVLIDAAARLHRAGIAQVAFVYCGDGPYRAALEQRATGLGLTNFHFMGKRSDVPRLLSSATIAVVPSLWAEAFGLTVVESMAAGVPVIATRTGGIPELLPADGGLLVDPGDVAQLATAIEMLLADGALRAKLSVRARAIAADRFSLEVCARNLHAVVNRELLRGGPKPARPLRVSSTSAALSGSAVR
jgi:glycosyltransferase involved in cell wall biosynthesis